MPDNKLSVGSNATYNKGDEFTIVSAKSKEALDEDIKWSFALDAPEGWRLDERVNADKYEVVLIADKSASIDTVTEENDKPYVEGGILYVNGATEGDAINIYATDGLL